MRPPPLAVAGVPLRVPAGLLGGLLAGLLAISSCGGGGTDPAALPAPGDVVGLMKRGSGRGVAVTTDSADDPRLRPHVYPLSPVQSAHAVVGAIDSLPGWEVVAGKDGVIWATRRGRLFPFVDDVYLLLLPAHDSTAIFARSASRLGAIDLGRNRRNLGELWKALDQSVKSEK